MSLGPRLVDRDEARGFGNDSRTRPPPEGSGCFFDKGAGPVASGPVEPGEFRPTAGAGARPEAPQAVRCAGWAALRAAAERRFTAAWGGAEARAKLG